MASAALKRMRNIELFGGCRRNELERIDQLGTTLEVRAQKELLSQGAASVEFFVLVSGLAEVHIGNGRVALLHAGAWFGETGLLFKTPRRATVTTVVDSTVIVFGQREFRALLEDVPAVANRLRATGAAFMEGLAPTHLHWYQQIRTPRLELLRVGATR
jgi:CRP-like cAMP-binding protein